MIVIRDNPAYVMVAKDSPVKEIIAYIEVGKDKLHLMDFNATEYCESEKEDRDIIVQTCRMIRESVK